MIVRSLSEEEIAEIDRNARAYGWEIGNGTPLNTIIEFSDDNPFLNSNWRDQLPTKK